MTVLLAWGSGCASGPLVVSTLQSRGNTVKLGYTEMRGGRQGIIECAAHESGDLHDCKHLQINFTD